MHSQDARQRWVAPSHCRAAVTSRAPSHSATWRGKIIAPISPPKYWWTCYSSPSMTHLYTTTTIIIMMRATHLPFASFFPGTLFYRLPLLGPLFHRLKLKCILFTGPNIWRLGERHWFSGNKVCGSHSWTGASEQVEQMTSFYKRFFDHWNLQTVFISVRWCQLEDKLSLPHRMELNSLTNVWKGRRPNLYESEIAHWERAMKGNKKRYKTPSSVVYCSLRQCPHNVPLFNSESDPTGNLDFKEY